MNNQVVVYKTGQSDIPVQMDAERRTIWTTQKQIAELLDLDISTVNRHIQNFKEQRGGQNRGIANFAITADDGKTYTVEHYDLTVVTYIGFRAQATDRTMAFQDWVGSLLDQALAPAKALTPLQQLRAMVDAMEAHEAQLTDHDQRIERLEAEIEGQRDGYFTIKGWCNLRKLRSPKEAEARALGRKASKLSRERSLPIDDTTHPIYGTVHLYADSVLAEVLKDWK